MAPREAEREVDLERKVRAMDEAPVGIAITDPGREDNPLVYVNDEFERLTGYERAEVLGRNCRFLQGEATDPDAVARLRTAIEAERPVTVELANYRADGERFWNEVTVAPLRDESGAVTNFVGFQSDVTDRKEAELALERHTRDLERLVDRIDGLLGDVTELLMHAGSREESEPELADRIAAADPYAGAWFGEPDRTAGTIHPTAAAGAPDPPETLEVDADDPTARAFRTRTVETAGAVEAGASGSGSPGAPSVAAVPIAYGETVYGVLTVYGTEPDTFDSFETVVVEALGRAIGTAIHAARTRRALSTDDVVELEFELREPGTFVVDLAAVAEDRLEYRGAVQRADGTLSLFFAVEGDPAAILDRQGELAAVEDVLVLHGDDDGALLEFHVAAGSIVTDLAEWSAETTSITLADGTARVRAVVPSDGDPGAVADSVLADRPGAELLAYRERETLPTTKREFVGDVEAALTDRQLVALRKAHAAGYFEWNRTTTGEDLAASMDVTPSTFHQHLRAAERKLLAEFFDR